MKNYLKQQNSIEAYLASDPLINYESPEVSSLAEKLRLKDCDEISAVKKAYECVRDSFPHTFDVNAQGVACSASDVIKLGHGVCYAKAHLLAALLRYAGIPAGMCYQRLCLETPDDQPGLAVPDVCGLSESEQSQKLSATSSTKTQVVTDRPETQSIMDNLETLSVTDSAEAQSVADSVECLSGAGHAGPPTTSCTKPRTRLVLHAANAVYLKSLNKWVRMDVRGNTNGVNAQFSVEHEQLAFKIHPQFDEEDGLVIYSKTPASVAHALSSSKTAQQLKENLPSYILDKESILFVTKRPEVVMEKGQGMYMWDTEGKKYLDFMGGWAVNCLGHSPAVIAEALGKQASTLVNCSPSFYNTQMLKFSRLLTQTSCFDKVFFSSSGAEANEGAIKLARKYGSKFKSGAYEIITTINGFHGRTLATMSATGKKQWEPLFAPKVSGFVHVPFNDAEAVKKAINEKTCAIMLEPVQGEGGVHVADKEYIQELRKICDENNILLIFDEIQTGIGRTGKMYAYEHYGIEPDIMTLAKGIGGGFPLSAMLTKKRFDIFDEGDQGGSYSSQPLAMSVGYAVVSQVIESALPAHAAKMGKYLMNQFNKIEDKFKLSNIRGLGLLVAFDLDTPRAAEIVSKCLSAGLAINSPQPYSIRLMPPLIVTETEIDEMLATLCSVLSQTDNDGGETL